MQRKKPLIQRLWQYLCSIVRWLMIQITFFSIPVLAVYSIYYVLYVGDNARSLVCAAVAFMFAWINMKL